MRATIYQTSPTGVARRWGLALRQARRCAPAAALLAAALLAGGCKGTKAPAGDARPNAGQAAVQQPPAPPATSDVLHFSDLAIFAPEQLLDFKGEAPETASTSKYGELAVSEFARSYRAGDKRARVRIVDTNANQGQRAPAPPEPYEDERKLARPFRVGGTVGYVEYEKQARLAKADLVVSDRVLVSIVCESASGPEDAERLAAAMDLGKLAQRVRQNAAQRAAAPRQ